MMARPFNLLSSIIAAGASALFIGRRAVQLERVGVF